jgi:hypothetical protein
VLRSNGDAVEQMASRCGKTMESARGAQFADQGLRCQLMIRESHNF